MKLVAIGMVKNEIDVVEAFVRHNLAFVDQFVLLDNGSTDGTLDVLRALARETGRVEVVEDPTPGKRQVQFTNRLLREHALARHAADWVLPLDGDEFVVVPPGGALVPAGAAADRPVNLFWRTYVPHPADDPAERNPAVRLRHRLAREPWPWQKVLVPRGLAERAGAALGPGNHTLKVDDWPAEAVAGDAWLAHLPLRSPGHAVAKVAVNVLQYASAHDRDAGVGWHYREAYDLLCRDPAAFRARYAELVTHYAQPAGAAPADAGTVADPLPYRGGPLRHTPALDDGDRGWLAVLRHAEALARRQAALAACLGADGLAAVDRVAAVLERLFESADKHARWHLHLQTRLAEAEGQAETARQALVGEQWRHVATGERLAAAEARAAAAEAALGHARFEMGRLLDELGEARAETERLRREAARVVGELHRSWTWRAGRLAVGPLARLRRLADRLRHAVVPPRRRAA
jgi:hypothetical protein